MRSRVVGIGAITVDDFLYLDRFPRSGEKMMVRDRVRAGGGLTATALVAAARLGVRAAYRGMLGRDELSRFALAGLERAGVDVSGIEIRPDGGIYNSTILVEVESGQRTILPFGRNVPGLRPEDVSAELFSGCGLFEVDQTAAAAGVRAAELARARGIPVVVDMEHAMAEGDEMFVELADHLITSREFARVVTGRPDLKEATTALASAGRACTAVTDGENGIWFCERAGEVSRVPAFRVAAVDTTGCGDVVHGAYAAAILQGDPVERALVVAAAAAALKASRSGGWLAIPGRAEVDRIIEEQGRSLGK